MELWRRRGVDSDGSWMVVVDSGMVAVVKQRLVARNTRWKNWKPRTAERERKIITRDSMCSKKYY